MGFVDFFKKLGKGFKRVFAVVGKVFTEAQLDAALNLVRKAADKFVDNADKRNWVVMQLMKQFHLPEYLARLLTEMAVAHLKHAEDKVFDELDKQLEGQNA